MPNAATDPARLTWSEQREEILAEAAAYLTSSLSPDEALKKLPHLLVPRFAEFASLTLRTGPDTYVRAATASSNEAMRSLAREEVLQLDPEAAAGIAAVIRTGRSELHATIPDAVYRSARSPEVQQLARAVNFQSAVIVPLVVNGEVIGAMAASSTEPGHFGEHDLRFLERFSRLAGISVQSARMLAELRLRDERLRVALNAAPILVFTQDRDLRYTWIETVAPGFSLESLLGHKDEEFFPPADAARITSAKRRAMETRERVREQMRLFFGNELRDFDLTVEPSINEDGEVTGVTCAAYDVTDIRRAEQAMEESEQRLRLAASAAAFGVFEWDIKGGKAVWENARMFEMLGRAETEGPVETTAFLERVHPADRESLGEAMLAAMHPGETLSTMFRIHRFDDDALRTIEITGRFELADDGSPVTLAGVMADVTDRQTVAEELARALAIKDEFLGLVSHELRTPMTLVTGYARNLARQLADADSDTRETAGALVSEAERLGSLIENMLVLARLDQERPQMDLIDPRLIARHCIDLHHARFPDRAVRLELRGRMLLAEGREPWVEQVLQNLLANAEKYSPADKPVEVSVREDGSWVRISVLDRGPGLSEEEAAHVFEPFYRTSGAHDRPGLGLGLTVCRRLVMLQGGDIWAARRRQGGAEFVFRLPRAITRED